MPFTPAHALAAAPVWYASRRRLDLPALVVGTLSPDFPYLWKLRPVGTSSHSMAGLLTFCLPASFAVVLAWRLFLREPILHLLTGRRSQPVPVRPSVGALLIVVTSILAGAATHVMWDSTSHSGGWVVARVPWLRESVLGIPIFKWNQYVSGCLGLLGVLIWCRLGSSPERGCPSPLRRKLRWVAHGMGVLCASGFPVVANVVHGGDSLQGAVVFTATGLLTGAACWAVLFSAAYHLVDGRSGVIAESREESNGTSG